MTCHFYTIAEIAEVLGEHERAVYRLAKKQGWNVQAGKARRRSGRGGGWEYHVSLLPDKARARLTIGVSGAEVRSKSSELWSEFEKLSKARKEACEERLKVVDAVEELVRGGMSETASITYIAKQFAKSERSIRTWRKKIAHVDRANWLPALADKYRQTTQFADCHAEAWEALKSDYLRPEKPSFSSCYRRVQMAAREHGWCPFPNSQALRRRLMADVPKEVMIVAREGGDKVKNLYPAQRRDRSMLHAMQAVNMDGHRFDVFIQIDEKEKSDRIHLIALQDLYSGKIVAWRLSKSEDKNVVRLCIGDMVARHGIPEKILLDNGRAFASKWITGQTKTRFSLQDPTRGSARSTDHVGCVCCLGSTLFRAIQADRTSLPRSL